jgi:hypothetical protein
MPIIIMSAIGGAASTWAAIVVFNPVAFAIVRGLYLVQMSGTREAAVSVDGLDGFYSIRYKSHGYSDCR